MNILRIILADDHVVMREGLKVLVNAQTDMQVVGEAGSGETTLQKALELQPDVIVMDISMPEMNGIQTTARLRDVCRNTKVLALTAHDDNGYLRQMLEVGASGYLLKRVAAEELVNAIRVVAEGGVYLDPMLAGKVVCGYVGKKMLKGSIHNKDLSERESEVLRLVAWGYTNKEIASYLNISPKTVEAHKTHFMQKLELKTRSEIVRYALRRGWLRET